MCKGKSSLCIRKEICGEQISPLKCAREGIFFSFQTHRDANYGGLNLKEKSSLCIRNMRGALFSLNYAREGAPCSMYIRVGT
jgi:hypothetical protein